MLRKHEKKIDVTVTAHFGRVSSQSKSVTYLLFCNAEGRFSRGKIALRSVCETLVCVKEFSELSSYWHAGM